ncbi:hypothetical protein L596_029483 [Steinernema carpocapsae]|uniref:Peptidase S1 domain-containing protein n=1 Tax=Steinernema carpocapsae TaxID=34508 RepID=A0A4U5LUT0_STECR|nr:hypothetical protein L596_029483 [Steinernema carpocapsae]
MLKSVVLLTFLFTVSLFAAKPKDLHPNFFTITRPGTSPSILKVSASENEEIQRICGHDDRSNNRPQYKVSGGERASVGRFPWAVAIADTADKVQQSTCGGTIISPKHFLSAAHCFCKYRKSDPSCTDSDVVDKILRKLIHYGGTCTRPGKHCKTANTQTTTVKKVHFARKFNHGGCRFGGDIAIVEIVGNFTFDDKTKPLCLPKPHKDDSDLNEYNVVTSYGYGKNENHETSDSLAFVEFSSKALLFGKKIRKVMKDVVWLMPNKGNKGICHGDSGSGLQGSRKTDGRKIFLGIHSKGGRPCGKRQPYSSTYLPFYVKSISKHTGVCPF